MVSRTLAKDPFVSWIETIVSYFSFNPYGAIIFKHQILIVREPTTLNLPVGCQTARPMVAENNTAFF